MLNFTSALHKSVRRYWGSHLCHCSSIWWVAGSMGKKPEFSTRKSPCSEWLTGLKNQIHRLTEINFTTNQKTKRAALVNIEHIVSLALQQREGGGEVYFILAIAPWHNQESTCKWRVRAMTLLTGTYFFSCKAGTKGEVSRIILFYLFQIHPCQTSGRRIDKWITGTVSCSRSGIPHRPMTLASFHKHFICLGTAEF